MEQNSLFHARSVNERHITDPRYNQTVVWCMIVLIVECCIRLYYFKNEMCISLRLILFQSYKTYSTNIEQNLFTNFTYT